MGLPLLWQHAFWYPMASHMSREAHTRRVGLFMVKLPISPRSRLWCKWFALWTLQRLCPIWIHWRCFPATFQSNALPSEVGIQNVWMRFKLWRTSAKSRMNMSQVLYQPKKTMTWNPTIAMPFSKKHTIPSPSRRGLPQLGTLGAGNHYAEIQVKMDGHGGMAGLITSQSLIWLWLVQRFYHILSMIYNTVLIESVWKSCFNLRIWPKGCLFAILNCNESTELLGMGWWVSGGYKSGTQKMGWTASNSWPGSLKSQILHWTL